MKNGNPGFAVVEEEPDRAVDAGDDWGKIVAVAKINPDTGSLTNLSPWDRDKFNRIKDDMASVARWLPAGSVSAMLVKLAERFDAVTLRDNGGVYWLVVQHLTEWEAIGSAVRAASATTEIDGQTREVAEVERSKLYCLHVTADEAMIEAVGDSLTAEIETTVRQREAEIADLDPTDHATVRKADAQVRKITELEQKIKTYEAAFDRPLTKLREQVQRVGMAAAEASLNAAAANAAPATLFDPALT